MCWILCNWTFLRYEVFKTSDQIFQTFLSQNYLLNHSKLLPHCIEEQNNNKLSYEIDNCGQKGWIHQVLINKQRNKFVVGSVHSKSLVASVLDGSITLRPHHINFSTQESCISKEGHKKSIRFNNLKKNWPICSCR